jgi:hypothetical protein
MLVSTFSEKRADSIFMVTLEQVNVVTNLAIFLSDRQICSFKSLQPLPELKKFTLEMAPVRSSGISK